MAKRNNQIEALAEEIQRYSHDIAREMAIHTRDALYKEADNAITKFYNHYDPIVYERHIPLGGNIRKSFRKHYKNNHDNTFSGGIELSPEWMDDIYNAYQRKNPVSTDYVFNLIYAGYHGNVYMIPGGVENVPPIMNPSPWELIVKKRDNLVKYIKRDTSKVANEVKNKGGYVYIR